MDMWKKSEILNNKKFRILLLLEVLLLLVPVIGILRGNQDHQYSVRCAGDNGRRSGPGGERIFGGWKQQYQWPLARNERFFHGTRHLLLLCDI